MRHYPIPIQGHFLRTVVLNEYKVTNTTQGKSCNTCIPMQQTNRRGTNSATQSYLRGLDGSYITLGAPQCSANNTVEVPGKYIIYIL